MYSISNGGQIDPKRCLKQKLFIITVKTEEIVNLVKDVQAIGRKP